jgi:hypothetical protein
MKLLEMYDDVECICKLCNESFFIEAEHYDPSQEEEYSICDECEKR